MSFDHTIKKGSTSKIIEVTLRDETTGLGKTGLLSSLVTASYVREGGTRTAITLASGTAGDVYSSGKWAEVDATNCRGLYQLHLPDAALASGVDAVTIQLQANGTIDKTARICLLDVDLYDDQNTLSASGVRVAVGLAAANLDTQLSTIDGNVDAVLVDTGTTIPAQIAALNDLSAAEVNAEVVDALSTDTYAELAAVPAATSSLKDKITWVFQVSRNKLTQTATTSTLYADDGSTSIATSTVSDDGTTFTKGEYS